MRFAIAQLAGLLLLPLVATAEPTLTTYDWMTNSSGRCVSGSFGDSSNWIGGTVPDALSLARFWYNEPDDGYTVTLPDMQTRASISIHARRNKIITFDGSGRVFQAVSTDEDNYKENFFSIYGGADSPRDSNAWSGPIQAGFKNVSFRAGYKLTDAVFSVKGHGAQNGSLDYVRFKQGTFNFYDPEGEPQDTSFYIFGGSDDKEVQYIFEPDSKFRINNIVFPDNSNTMRKTIRFNGNTHYVFGDLWFNRKNDVGHISSVHVDNGATLYAGRLRMSNAKPSASNYTGTHRMIVENGGVLVCSNGVNIAAYGTQLVAITNGAHAVFGTESTLPLNKIMGMNNSATEISSTNALFVKDAALTMVGTNQFSSMHLVLDNATATFAGSFEFGKNDREHTWLAATNSTINIVDIGGEFGNAYGQRVTIDLYNAKINGIGSGRLCFGSYAYSGSYALNSSCDLTMDGPESEITVSSAKGNLGGQPVYLGYNGSSVFRMKDGSINAYGLGMACATYCVTSVLHQTGGRITVMAGKYSADETSGFSVNAASSGSCNAYCRVILDGGEICAHRFRAIYSRMTNPASGRWSQLDANGGTIVGLSAASAENNVMVNGFDEANLGENGLTIRSSFETRTAQDFRDMVGHEGRGLLRLEGVGTKKLFGTNSTESVLCCAGGRTLFVPNADTGANARHYSNVIVTNGATLSLAGAQTAASFKSLDLAEGARLELEKADRVTCDGAVSVGGGLSIDIADAAAAGTYPLVVCPGEASTETALNWTRARVTAAESDGYVLTPRVTYDAQADETTFSLDIAESEPLTGETVWQNEGCWDGAMLVKFTDASPAAVSVNSAAAAGAVRFDANKDFTLSGAGPLTFSDNGGNAAMETVRGVQTVETPLEVPRDMRITVASGATNAITGAITGGGIVKDGRGTAQLTNAQNSFPNGVTVKEGLLSASDADALGGAPIVLSGGTLELTSDGELQSGVEVATHDAATAAIVKVEGDVTMPARSATRGAFIKRGAGRLTLTSDCDVALCGIGSGTLATLNDSYVSATTTFDGEGNYGVGGQLAFGGFNVAEGELVLRGTADNVTFTAPSAYTCVGICTSSGAANPGLVVDHATFYSYGARICLANTYNSKFGVAPYIVVTNKSTFFGSFTCGRNASTAGLSARMLVDDSVQYSGYKFYPMRAARRADYVYRNGSALYVGDGDETKVTSSYCLEFDAGRATMTFSNSVLARKTGLESSLLLPVAIFSTVDWAKHEIYMRDGSTLYSNWVSNKYDNASCLLTVAFDNSEWKPIRSDQTGDFTFDFPQYNGIRFEMEGRGVILSPSAGKTFTMVNPLVGDGGMRKRGAGTLAFACKNGMKSWDFGGTMSLEEGTVTLAAGAVREGAKADIAGGAVLDLNGATLNGATLSGSGTVANGTLTSPTFLIDVPEDAEETPHLTFVGVVAVTGRLTLDFGRTLESPLSTGTVVPLATLKSAFDPSAFEVRVVNAGSDANDGKLFVEDGVLYCRMVSKGFYLIVR